MRTLIISYDLAKPHVNKHVVAQAIMSLGKSWARPLDQTWYVKTKVRESAIEALLSSVLDSEDGLLIQSVKDDAVLTNTALRWFRQRVAPIETAEETNLIAFPHPHPRPGEQNELPLAEAC